MSLTSYRAAPSRDNTVYWRSLRGALRAAGWPCGRCATVWPSPTHRGDLESASTMPWASKTPKGLPLWGQPFDFVNGLYLLPLASMPGDDLLFHTLRHSTIGAVWFHGRVRDGIGWVTDAMATKQWGQWMRVFKSMHTHGYEWFGAYLAWRHSPPTWSARRQACR